MKRILKMIASLAVVLIAVHAILPLFSDSKNLFSEEISCAEETLFGQNFKIRLVDEAASIANYTDDTQEPGGWTLFPSIYWDSNNNGIFDANEGIGSTISPSVHFTCNGQAHHFWPLHQSIMKDPEEPHVVSSGWISYPNIYRSTVEDSDRLITLEFIVALNDSHFSQQVKITSTSSAALTNVSLINYLGIDINEPQGDYAYIDHVHNNMLKACDNETGVWFGAYPTTNASNYEISEWNDGPYEGEDLWQHTLNNELDGTDSANGDIEAALQFNLGEIQANQSKSITTYYSAAGSENDLYLPNGIHVTPTYSNFYTYTTATHSKFNVTLWVHNASNLYAYQVTLYYNATQLKATRAWVPTSDTSWVFYGKPADARATVPISDWVRVNATLVGQQSSFNGTGLLGAFEFEIIYAPTSGMICSSLDINNAGTYLLNPSMIEISTSKNNGYYEYDRMEIHDVAVTAVMPSKNIVCQGYKVRINVTVTNQGTQTETVTVRICLNTTWIQTDRTLTSGNTTTVTFTWTTPTQTADPNYTLTAYALPVPNETHLLDNTLAGDLIRVTTVGDINADNKVDVKDVYKVARAYGSAEPPAPSPPGYPWNPVCDINDNGKVDVTDYYIACLHYGETAP